MELDKICLTKGDKVIKVYLDRNKPWVNATGITKILKAGVDKDGVFLFCLHDSEYVRTIRYVMLLEEEPISNCIGNLIFYDVVKLPNTNHVHIFASLV
jgi:hypothetical protein